MPIWILVISWITRIILALLIFLSIWSIAIMLDRLKALRREDQEDIKEPMGGLKTGDHNKIREWLSGKTGMRAQVVAVTLDAQLNTPGGSEALDRSVRSVMSQYRMSLEKGLSVLASLGSNAPFIGLFGTVLGIIQAFGALAYQQGSMNVVMASISEALVATAVGLFVAIPALVAYNYFARRIKLIVVDCESFRDLYVALKNGRS